MKTWLVIDVSYMCHRAFHTMKELSWKGKPTGVVFGFLKSISALKDEFATDRIAFCFEHPHLLRKDIYPAYKHKRHTAEKPAEEKAAYSELHRQINQLRNVYLPQIGFQNVFCYDGFESDDIMAAIALNCPEDEEVILVTADSDLLQCLRANVSIYSPQARKIHTYDEFVSKFGFHPCKWAKVKAIAGCDTDEVEGVAGVGDIGATRYVQGRLPERTFQYQAILSAEGKALVRRNRRLVQLPFQGCPVPHLVEDEVDRAGWIAVCGLLGMRSIAQHPPVATRARGK